MQSNLVKMWKIIIIVLSFVFGARGSHEEFFFSMQAYYPQNNIQETKTPSVMAGSVRDCADPNDIYLPPTATNTTKRLTDLRGEMLSSNFSAYIVPSTDAHLSEYLAPSDKRRVWITGFSGSAGTAVITLDKAALWTDGRYFEQAEKQLDCNWILMKSGEVGVPTIEEWLISELSDGSTIGANPFLFSINSWLSYKQTFSPNSITMMESIPDLIDVIWNERPSTGGGDVMILSLNYTGVVWKTKLDNVRKEMNKKNVNFLLITVLDEIAWFFNLRGEDIPYTPVFISYVIVSDSSHLVLYANQPGFEKEEVKQHLNTSDCEEQYSCVVIKPYEQARDDLMALATVSANNVWMPSDGTTYGMYSAVDTRQQLPDESPLKVAKAVKNPIEVKAMRQAHVYDAVALCEYVQWLEINVPLGVVDEISGSEKLKSLRLAQITNRGLSFGSISASGPNSAVIHYGSTPETNRNLTTTEMYMIDSGGQYLGGTTDVTRTMHLGEPTEFQKETFTRALAGMIDVQMAVFPYTKDGNYIDILARKYLYEIGLEYRHGTGHGIGQYLAIHEYPPGIGTSLAEGYPLQPGMFTSVEPGYYEEGSFGLRHENINVVIEANTTYNFGGYKFHTFDPVTLVPFQLKMIKTSLLSDKQINYLNYYHSVVQRMIGNEAELQGKVDVKHWLDAATVPLERSGGTSTKLGYLIIITMVSVTFSIN